MHNGLESNTAISKGISVFILEETSTFNISPCGRKYNLIPELSFILKAYCNLEFGEVIP